MHFFVMPIEVRVNQITEFFFVLIKTYTFQLITFQMGHKMSH